MPGTCFDRSQTQSKTVCCTSRTRVALPSKRLAAGRCCKSARLSSVSYTAVAPDAARGLLHLQRTLSPINQPINNCNNTSHCLLGCVQLAAQPYLSSSLPVMPGLDLAHHMRSTQSCSRHPPWLTLHPRSCQDPGHMLPQLPLTPCCTQEAVAAADQGPASLSGTSRRSSGTHPCRAPAQHSAAQHTHSSTRVSPCITTNFVVHTQPSIAPGLT